MTEQHQRPGGIIRKTATVLIVAVLLLAAWDWYLRHSKRTRLGPGVTLRSQQLISVVAHDPIRPARLKPGDTVRFRIVPPAPVGSTTIGDGFLTGAMIRGRIVHAGYSEQLGRAVVLFEFTELQFPSGGLAVEFRGSIFSPDDPQHSRDAGVIGSFVGMEFGPVGIVAGYLVGTLFPSIAGRNLEAPLSYAIDEIRPGTELVIKCHYADYVPFQFNRR